ncbi:MAG: efflux RND transporter permease subunit [Bacteroidales bacterium]|nr:efflux RND transporter permease subunit [Candidatus Equibacterium intestinale]
MNIKTFIDRPVLSTVISVVLVLGGIIGLASLAIERYPDIAPPTINVSATYPGASAETVMKSVIVPLEEAINGVENMTYMYSNATNSGTANIQVYFKQGTNADMDAVNVQNCVSRATRSLPTEVTELGVTVRKRQTSMLLQVAVYSPDNSYNREFITNYMKINLVPAISRIPGVGDVDVRGADYSMRIWLKPDVMAQYKLIPQDVMTALNEQNIEAATGSLGENSDNTYEYTLRYKGRLEKPEQFENIVIRALPSGEVLRLKDLAEIELGATSYSFIGSTNGCNGSSISVYQSPGSNATEVINSVEAYLEEARKDFPIDLEMTVLSNSNDFLYASIKNVVRTLLEAILLVILVVFIFLRNAKATVIPLIATVVSIVGTFLFLYVFGFSINLLTLFALVLSIGVVVDDSIIVVEAVQTKYDIGYRDSKKAAIDAMHDVTSALITSSLVFMAVFLPVSMMGGTSGKFYTQFGITMAVSVGISAINALTLSPALCAMWLSPKKDEKGNKVRSLKRLGDAFEAGFESVRRQYLKVVQVFLHHRWLAPVCVALGIVLLVYNMSVTKTGLIPNEDVGVLRIDVTTKPGSSLSYTRSVMNRIENDIVKGIDEKRAYEAMTGFSMLGSTGSTHGAFTIRLKPWDERPGKEHSVDAISKIVKDYSTDMNDADLFVFTPGMIPGYGASNGYELYIQDRKGGDIESLYKVTTDIIDALKQRPEIGSANTSFNPNYPQYQIDLDAARCKRAGISPNEVLSVLNGYLGGRMSTRFNRFTKLYQVMVQAEPKYRVDKQALNNIYVRIGDEMAPVSQFVSLTKVYAPENLSRFNLFPCIKVNGKAAEGYSSGDAINAIREVSAEVLPIGYGYDFGGITREEANSTSNTMIIFIICFALIYFILCALYESYLLPFAVLLILPFGLTGSFWLARIMGLENNIYLQTGLIMLIGLLSKTSILITEYAVMKRRSGMGLAASALYATKERFRPIMMTVLTMIVGLFPLLVSNGVGANGNNTLGAGVIGGMLVGTLCILFMVPSLFVAFEWLQEKLSPKKFKELCEMSKQQ